MNFRMFGEGKSKVRLGDDMGTKQIANNFTFKNIALNKSCHGLKKIVGGGGVKGPTTKEKPT